MNGQSHEERKLRIEALLKLQASSWRSMDHRRAYEWKVNFGLWTALGLIAGAQLRGDIALATHPWSLGIICLALLAVGWIYLFSWTKGLHGANAKDKDFAADYRRLVEKEIGSVLTDSPERYANQKWYEAWSHRSQAGFTLLLIAIAILAAFVPPKPKEQPQIQPPTAVAKP